MVARRKSVTTIRKEELQAKFLKAVSLCGSVSEASDLVRIDSELHYHWMADKVYAEQYEIYRKRFIDVLEREAKRRAVDGYDEEKFVAGVLIESTRKRDAGLLSLLLKANSREKYGDKVETNNTNKNLNLDVPVTPEDLAKLTDEQLDSLTRLGTAFQGGVEPTPPNGGSGATRPPPP